LKSSAKPKLDRLAIFLSGLCLVHCLALPFALLLGPALGQWLTTTETQMHWLLLSLAAPVSMLAFWRGYKLHQSALTVGLGTVGLVSMLVGVAQVFGPAHEVWLTVVGVSLVLLAHIRNTFSRHGN